MFWIAVAVALLLMPILVVLVQIGNWKRDFTTNEAETSESASDPLLRPLDYPGDIDQLAEIVKRSANDLPRWKFVEQRGEGETVTLHLTRTTPVFGFVDDIHVTLEAREDTVRLTARSKSRIGKGDLGQNPRNLKELLKAVQRRLRVEPS